MNSFDIRSIDFTNPTVLIGAVVVLLLIFAAIGLAAHQRRRKSEALREKFGTEYELAVRQHGSRNKAEARLLDRVHRVNRFQLRDLSPIERERFVAQWDAVQLRFVDHPRGTVTEADELVNTVMLARGFPAASFDQRIEDISVNHAPMVDSYRSANTIAARAARNEATTEELRTAMIHYRAIFDDLLETGTAAASHEIPAEATRLRRSA